jgi:hypothetical protein
MGRLFLETMFNFSSLSICELTCSTSKAVLVAAPTREFVAKRYIAAWLSEKVFPTMHYGPRLSEII